MNRPTEIAVSPNFMDRRDIFSSVFNRLLLPDEAKAGEFLRVLPMSSPGCSNTAESARLTNECKSVSDSDHVDSMFSTNTRVNPVLLVSGLLGDSIKSLIAPVMFARTKLVLQGYEIEMAWVNGRSGCDMNARQLRDKVLACSAHHGCPITVIGYSKGCADAMHMLVNHPETQSSVATLVSLAGVVGGTPLAEKVSGLARALLNWVPLPGIPAGDGRAIADLELRYRREWLQDNQLPESVRYVSLIAVPEATRVSRVLLGGYKALSETSPANDSQVIDRDAILPDSELLGIANADHWAIALPISRRFGRWVKPLVNHNDYPRTVLMQAIIEYLALTAPANGNTFHTR